MASGDPEDWLHQPGEPPMDDHDVPHVDDNSHAPFPTGHRHGLYGTPAHDSGYWEQQEGDFTCGIMSQKEIFHCLTGEHLPELNVAVEAASQGLLTTDGTLPAHMGRWLESHGIPCHENDHATFLDVIRELRDGNKIMVDVNADALWHSNNALQAFGENAKDHAIWLTGVDVSDPHHVKVIINDSGRPDGAGNVYDLHELEKVLHAPAFHYVATGMGKELHIPDNAPGYDAGQGAFPELDEFLHDHAMEIGAGAGIAAAALGAAALMRLRSAPDIGIPQLPVPIVPGGPATTDWHGTEPLALGGPPKRATLPAPPPRLEDLTRSERDAILRKL